ncbi:MAG: hypothetical protein ABJA62_05510 [Luteimonas sp.]
MSSRVWISGFHNILLVIGVVSLFFIAEAFIHQWLLTCDAVIVKVSLVCEQPLNNRCQYEYIGRNESGDLSKIELGFTVNEDEVRPGDAIKKDKFGLKYYFNGRRHEWQFSSFYVQIFLLSLFSFFLWRYLTVRQIAKTPGIAKG